MEVDRLLEMLSAEASEHENSVASGGREALTLLLLEMRLLASVKCSSVPANPALAAAAMTAARSAVREAAVDAVDSKMLR